jgi:glycosyltransferase involved in cell wall biosynthesis
MGRGAEGAHIAHIVRAFERAGHEVILVSPPGIDPLAKVGDKPLDKTDEKTSGLTRVWKIISRHAPQIFFEFLEIGYNFSAVPRLKRLTRQHAIDFIFERNAFFLFAGARTAKKTGIPLLVEANEAVGIERARPLLLKRIALACERYTLTRARACFTVSSYLADMLKKNVPDGTKVQVLPNAVDPVLFSCATRRDEIRKKYNLTDKIVMGFAGWFDWWDRLDLLIEVQSRLSTLGYDNLVTLLIGHGAMVEELEQQILDCGLENKVFLTGSVDKEEVLDYIDALDIGVLAHSNEFGSPMVMFEMMALGKTVVAPNLAPVTDVLIDRENGLLFPRLDVDKLTDQLTWLLNNTQEIHSIGQRARTMIMEQHTWQKNAEQILQIASDQQPGQRK